MRLLVEGSWWLTSKSDPRWNCHGRAKVGGLVEPKECVAARARLVAELGPEPEDLEWGYMKD